MRLSVPVISASDLWDAMEPEVTHTVRAHLEDSTDSDREDEDEEREGQHGSTDRETAVQIAQYLRHNKYRLQNGFFFPFSSYYKAQRLCVLVYEI